MDRQPPGPADWAGQVAAVVGAGGGGGAAAAGAAGWGGRCIGRVLLLRPGLGVSGPRFYALQPAL